MTAPPQRRALPAVVFIAILTVLTAIVWVRVLGDGAGADSTDDPVCTTPAAPSPSVAPVNKQVSVIVLNSTDRENLAAKTKVTLKKDRFKVVAAANDEPSYGGHGVIGGVAEIRFGPALAPAATVLSYYFPGAKLVRTDSSSPSVIVALGEKFTKVTARVDVIRQLSHDGIRLTTESVAPLPQPTPTC